MKINLKRLKNDLLEVCRMLDDKPEAKICLSEITFDVSLLTDTAYGIDNEIEIPAERLAILEQE